MSRSKDIEMQIRLPQNVCFGFHEMPKMQGAIFDSFGFRILCRYYPSDDNSQFRIEVLQLALQNMPTDINYNAKQSNNYTDKM